MEEAKKITDEEIKELLKKAKSPEDLIAFANECSLELTPEDAQKLFDALHAEGELSDDQLEGVAGGNAFTDFFKDVKKTLESLGDTISDKFKDIFCGDDCPKCGSREGFTEEWQFGVKKTKCKHCGKYVSL